MYLWQRIEWLIHMGQLTGGFVTITGTKGDYQLKVFHSAAYAHEGPNYYNTFETLAKIEGYIGGYKAYTIFWHIN